MKNVMIVEDDIIVLEGLKSIVSKLGYNVVAGVVDAASAIAKLEHHAIDFVFLDIDIEGERDGIWLASFINKHYDIPFIYTTGNDDIQTIETAIKTNPCSYLIKPFKEKDIVSAIEMVKQRIKTHNEIKAQSVEKSVFLLQEDDGYEKHNFDSILFIELAGEKNKIFTKTKTSIVSKSILEIEKVLPEYFFQIHPSFIINANKVIRVGVDSVILKDNFLLPIAKELKADVIRKLKIID